MEQRIEWKQSVNKTKDHTVPFPQTSAVVFAPSIDLAFKGNRRGHFDWFNLPYLTLLNI